jgi:hypothetical protein
MRYRFTRSWGQASVFVGAGLFAVALLLAWWLGFSSDEGFERFSPAVRILAAMVVSLVGLLVGGTMIVAGQLVSVLLDQRTLLVQIHEALTGRPSVSEKGLSG